MVEHNSFTITSDTRMRAKTFQQRFGSALFEAVKDCVENTRMPDDKFLELFSIPRSEMIMRREDYNEALNKMQKGETPNLSDIYDGMQIIAGLTKIAKNADAKAPQSARPEQVEEEFRFRNELGGAPLKSRDKQIIRSIAASRLKEMPALEQDAVRWQEAAIMAIEISRGTGIDVTGYAEGLGIGRHKG